MRPRWSPALKCTMATTMMPSIRPFQQCAFICQIRDKFMASSDGYFRHAYTSNVEIAFRKAAVIGHCRLMKISLTGRPSTALASAPGVVSAVFRRHPSLLTLHCFKPGFATHESHPPPRARARRSFRRQAPRCPPARSRTGRSGSLRILVGTSPGGSPDIIGRLLADKMADRLGQSITVENNTGGGGGIAASMVTNAPPDGYSMTPADSGLGQRRGGRKIRVRRRQHLRLPQHGLRLSVHLCGAEGFADPVVRRHAGARQGQSGQDDLCHHLARLGLSPDRQLGRHARPAWTWCRCPIAARPPPSPT